MEIFEIVLMILEPALELLFVRPKHYRNIDYIIFFIISTVVLLIAFGNLKIFTIFICFSLAFLISSILGTISNALMKKENEED